MAQEEERTLTPAEDTADSTGPEENNEAEEAGSQEEDTSSKNEGDEKPEGETEETAEQLKERLKKAEEERDNYKRGLLAAKAKDRGIDKKPASETKPADLSDDRIRQVLYKDNEKRVLRRVIDDRDDMYLPELVDDVQFQQIVGYLPRSLDRSSEAGIHKALKLAVQSWKFDRGIKDSDSKPKGKPEADLAASKTSSRQSSPSEKPASGRKILKSSSSPLESWYPSKKS